MGSGDALSTVGGLLGVIQVDRCRGKAASTNPRRAEIYHCDSLFMLMVSRPHRDLVQSFDSTKVGQLLRHSLAETVLVSAVFYLVLFGLLVMTGVALPTPEPVFIALLPFLVLLISSGRIQELRFGDLSMKFQRAVQGGISPDFTSETFNVDTEEMAQKGGTNTLDRMIEN